MRRGGRGGVAGSVRRQKLWVSLDIADVSGYAVWLGDTLLYCGEIAKKPRSKGRWQDVRHYPGAPEPAYSEYPTEETAWQGIIDPLYGESAAHIVVEQVFVGPNRMTIISLARRHGRIQAFLGDKKGKLWIAVENAKWRRASKDLIGGKWPKGRDEKKKAAMQAVVKAFGIDAGPDVADAVLVGRWFAGQEK